MPKAHSLAVAALLLFPSVSLAQKAPEMGYIYPSAFQSDSTVEVQLGGFDWTPDMDILVFDAHQPPVEVKITGEQGPVIVPPPPYWFGPRGRDRAMLMPTETPAEVRVPQGHPPGPVRWRAANANGVTKEGTFYVTRHPLVLEDADADSTRVTLPAAVCGRISKIEEVDLYTFTTPEATLVHLETFAIRIGSELNLLVEVRDSAGRLVADGSDTAGVDMRLSFVSQPGETYTVRMHDIDFRGNQAFVYCLELSTGPKLLATVPAFGQRGTESEIELIGIGLTSGQNQLETIRRKVKFPADEKATEFRIPLDANVNLASNPLAEQIAVKLSNREEVDEASTAKSPLKSGLSVTGVLDQEFGEDRYTLTAVKGDKLHLEARNLRDMGAMDLTLTVFDETGKQIVTNDDMPGMTDAGLDFTAPADGTYTVVVQDVSGLSGDVTSLYRLTADPFEMGFEVETPDVFGVVLGHAPPAEESATPKRRADPGDLTVKIRRLGGYRGPVSVRIEGLPQGITVPDDLQIPANQVQLFVTPTCLDSTPVAVSRARIVCEADLTDDGKKKGEVPEMITRSSDEFLVAVQMKPRVKFGPVLREAASTVHRGTTFSAEIELERLEGFTGEIWLDQAAQQGRHRQGIRGPVVRVPEGQDRIHYPVFLPQWLETSRTSRMVLVARVVVPDGTGRPRHLLAPMDNRITMTIEGAILTLTHDDQQEYELATGGALEIPFQLARSPKLSGSARLELELSPGQRDLFAADPIEVAADAQTGVLRIRSLQNAAWEGPAQLTVKATVMDAKDLPVVSQTTVKVYCQK